LTSKSGWVSHASGAKQAFSREYEKEIQFWVELNWLSWVESVWLNWITFDWKILECSWSETLDEVSQIVGHTENPEFRRGIGDGVGIGGGEGELRRDNVREGERFDLLNLNLIESSRFDLIDWEYEKEIQSHYQGNSILGVLTIWGFWRFGGFEVSIWWLHLLGFSFKLLFTIWGFSFSENLGRARRYWASIFSCLFRRFLWLLK
jgi:hypothetical protein